MEVYITSREITQVIKIKKAENNSIGFVPTMGALHNGHLTLMEEALRNNDYVVVSVFVNPTQFNNTEDLEKYPRTLEHDIALLESISKDVLVFAPSVEVMYEGNTTSQHFDFDGLEYEMEGKFRQGHFNGVGTVVKRLFEIVKPDNAYFGEKDFQQLQIIKKLVGKYNIPVNVLGCKIHRESNGLAMSSRNTRLKPEYKKAAPFIYKVLKKVRKKFGPENIIELNEWVENQFKKHPFFKLEYFTIADEKSSILNQLNL